MSGGVSFTKLDLSHAYLQLKPRDYLAINTQKGLFEYTIYVVSAINFSEAMDNLLQGLEHVAVYILITGRTEEEHLSILS